MRRRRDSHNSNQLLEKIENLKGTPLRELSFILSDLLIGAEMHGEDGKYQISEFVRDIIERLPKSFGDRFLFDSFLIQSTLSSWSSGSYNLSNLVIPTYSTDWGYEVPIFIQVLKSDQLHRLDLIRVPSVDSKDLPSLLDYPWLFHELGHYLISRFGNVVLNFFVPNFKKFIAKLKMRAIADTGVAKTLATNVTDEISSRWLPQKTISEPNWLREIIVDVIALWALGPAYLEAYEYEHQNVPDPFLLEQDHPPVELRTRALIIAGNKLDWDDYLKNLEGFVKLWNPQIPEPIRNKYISLSHNELIHIAISAALEFCSALKIPRFTYSTLEMIGTLIKNNDIPDNSVEVIVGAYSVYQNNQALYDEWETRIIESLIAEIKQ